MCAWIADHMEIGNIYGMNKDWCPVCEVPPARRSEHPPKSPVPAKRDYAKYMEFFESPTQHPKLAEVGMKLFRHGLMGTTGGSIGDLWRPDLLHTVYLGVIDDAFGWAIAFLTAEGVLADFDNRWSTLPSYPDWAPPRKPFQAVSMWTGKEMR